MVGIDSRRPFFPLSNQCVTLRSQLRVLLARTLFEANYSGKLQAGSVLGPDWGIHPHSRARPAENSVRIRSAVCVQTLS